MVMLAPIFYGAGTLTNAAFDSEIRSSLVPATICIFIGVINFFNPYNLFQKIVILLEGCIPCLSYKSFF
jgi:hypothetical protein